MELSQTFTIIAAVVGVNIALFGCIATLVVWAVNKIDSDVKSVGSRIDTDVKSIGVRMDSLASRMDGHASRIDQLYLMFCDLVKKKD